MYKKEFKEFIDEVSDLVKYTGEIEMVTKYKAINKPNIEFIRRTLVNYKKAMKEGALIEFKT